MLFWGETGLTKHLPAGHGDTAALSMASGLALPAAQCQTGERTWVTGSWLCWAAVNTSGGLSGQRFQAATGLHHISAASGLQIHLAVRQINLQPVVWVEETAMFFLCDFLVTLEGRDVIWDKSTSFVSSCNRSSSLHSDARDGEKQSVYKTLLLSAR